MRGGGGMFIHTVTARRVRLLAAAGALVLCGAAVFLYPSAAAAGASRGMALCSSVIIPSLLPFLVLCGTFLHSALCKAAGRVLRRPTALLFRLPGCCGAPVLMAFVGGYPAGAAAIATLLERREITEKDAERMLHFCVCAGPAFTVGAVGSGMLGSAARGWLLLAAQWGSALLIALFEARFAQKPAKEPSVNADTPLPLSAAFAAAVNSACLSLLYMCGFVVLFSVLLSLLDGSGLAARLYALSPYAASLTAGALEVSSGCLSACADAPVSYFLLGLLLGFAGISVQCQVRALLRAHPAVCRRLFTYRLLHGLLTGLLAVLLFSVVPLPAAVIAADAARIQWFTASPYVSLAMLALCMTACFSVGIDKRR